MAKAGTPERNELPDRLRAHQRIVSIDVARGFAILWVILYHVWTDLRYPNVYARQSDAFRAVWDDAASGRAVDALAASGHAFLRIGYLGVPLFMLLSGVSLTMSAMRRDQADGGADARRTSRTVQGTLRRMRRLLLPYYAGLAITVVFAAGLALVQWLRHGSDGYGTYLVDGDINLHGDQIVAGSLIVPRIFRDEWQFAPEGSLWFVLVLLQYYLLLPVLLAALRRWGPAALAGATLAVTWVSLGVVAAVDGDLEGHRSWIEIGAPFRIFEFGAGMAMGCLLMRSTNVARVARSARALVSCVGTGGVLFLLGAMIDPGDGWIATLAFPLIVSGLVLITGPFLAVKAGTSAAPALALAAVGVVSYTMLIVSEPLRSITHTMRAEGAGETWIVLWVGAFFLLTLVMARPLARVLGLTPSEEPRLRIADLTSAPEVAVVKEAVREPVSDP